MILISEPGQRRPVDASGRWMAAMIAGVHRDRRLAIAKAGLNLHGEHGIGAEHVLGRWIAPLERTGGRQHRWPIEPANESADSEPLERPNRRIPGDVGGLQAVLA